MIYSQKQIDRFWNNVAVGGPDDCWNWKLSQHSNGYGQVGLRINAQSKILKAHKVAWEIHHNVRLPHGARAKHTCSNKLCCNPHHVIVSTESVHAAYMKLAHARGEVHGMSKLTERQVKIIKYRLNALTTREVADAFSIGYNTIWDIRKGITWRHV